MTVLPAMIDAKGLSEEMGFPRTTAYRIIHEIARDTGALAPDSIRKVWVRREDVEAWRLKNTKKVPS